jgi:sialic acid synthase SpsE
MKTSNSCAGISNHLFKSMEFKIGNRLVGENHAPYFIADVGANHDGDLSRAFRLIELAKEAGADAVKFQNFQASKIVSKFGFENLGGAKDHQANWKKSVFETYEDASISMDWTVLLKQKCDEAGITYFTSPYDFASIDHIDPFVELYKIGSGDITWTEIIDYIGSKGKPVLLATGAASSEDVHRAMNILQKHTDNICLMQCNTNYTTNKEKYKYVNLNVLKRYQQEFPGVVLGLSDHTLGIATVVGAVSLGARIFEKHFTDDNNRIGPDHSFAMNPENWRQMVDNANEVYQALGDGIKRIEENEKDAVIVQQRSLRAAVDLPIGKVILAEDLEALRPIPKDGIQPYKLDEIVGSTLIKPLVKGEHITYSHFNTKK